jgi:hypothetical protein
MFSSKKILASGNPPKITITQQPENQTAVDGTATFTTEAIVSNGRKPNYQWSKGELSGAGANWTQGTLPTKTRWTGVAYGNGKFVAISGVSSISSGGDVAAISTGGGSWTRVFMPRRAEWTGITYGNGVFVAISYSYFSGMQLVVGDVAAVSTDGTNWIETKLPSSSGWLGITYGNGKFIATSNGSEIAVSTNGYDWVLGSMPSSARWKGITYGNGKFVAVVDGPGQYVSGSGWTNNAAYSTDAVNWTHSTLPENPEGATVYWEGVAYGNGKFVAVAGATESKHVAYSTDGITWTSSLMPYTLIWSNIAYGGGMFVAVSSGGGPSHSLGYGTNALATSQDGVSWIGRSTGTIAAWTSIVYGNDRFVTVANSQANADQNDRTTNKSAFSIADTTTWSGIGEDSPNLELTRLTPSENNGNKYYVTVSSPGATSVTSETVTLTVD